jgi:fructose-1,6-bisphosphatase/inositol monophosphatase family enzyme
MADRAAEIALRAFKEKLFTTAKKPDGSLVTSADLGVEKALRRCIQQRRQDDSVVGEELGGSAEKRRCWCLDPIDGKSAFVEGSDRWGTLISLAEDDTVIATVADYSGQGQRFWATLGAGAFANGNRLQVSVVQHLSEATVCDDSRHRIASQEKRTSAGPACRTMLCDSSTPRSLDACCRFRSSRSRPWHWRRPMTGSLIATNGQIHDQVLAAMSHS